VPHVTFIHGISNKPPANELLRLWREALADAADPVPLGDLGVTSTIVYWADLLYQAPDQNLSAYEGVLESTPEAIDASGAASPPMPGTAEEAKFLAGLAAKMTVLSAAEMAAPDTPPVTAAPQGALERVPLPWFLKKRFLDVFLRDVHHYLFDVEFAPPGRPAVRIQQTIRRRVLDALSAPEVSRPHVIVSHSLGTVIAYDCLKRVPECLPVDGLITFGSPLGLDEVQDRLEPEWTRHNGFPQEKLRGRWVNLFDRLDPVCGFDPAIANDFQSLDNKVIEDFTVRNQGNWRHSATKYLRQPAFCSALRKLLDL
jgi:hypothetical protein